MVTKVRMALAKVNEYPLEKETPEGSMKITLPKQFMLDNRNADKVVVYLNALNPTEVVVRAEKES